MLQKAAALVHRQRRGSLVDLHADDGSGAIDLALRLAARSQGATRTIVVVDADGDFYPPAAAQAGVDLGRLIVVRSRAVLACLDEALRSKSVAAAIARLKRLDGSASHRLRLAAEAGGGLGLLVRPLAERTAVSAAAVRAIVRRRREGVAVEPFRVRSGVGDLADVASLVTCHLSLVTGHWTPRDGTGVRDREGAVFARQAQ